MSPRLLRRLVLAALVLGGVALTLPPALANHGPGTSGGGSATVSGETLAANAWDLSLRVDDTEFKNVGRAGAIQHALRSGEFDGLRRGVLATANLAYGVTDDLQLGASWGYYRGRRFLAAGDNGGSVFTVADADPQGVTDLWLDGKYRLLRDQLGNISVIAGLKLPTGRDDVKLSNGEELEPSSQPGSGAIDGRVGAALSRYLTSKITLDTSAVYTRRGRHDHFTVGDRFDAGVAVAYRITDSVTQFPNWNVFAEANVVWIGRDDDHGEKNENSGGTTLFLTPGYRIRFTKNVAFTFAPSFPVVQSLNGDQVKTQLKLAATLSFTF